MKKITGKALSLVLSLALVVSSFSATFASAATTEAASTDGTVAILKGNTVLGDTASYQDSGDATADLQNLTSKIYWVDQYGKDYYSPAAGTDQTGTLEWYSSDDSVVKLATGSKSTANPVNFQGVDEGTATLTIVYSGYKLYDRDGTTGNSVTVNGSKSLTVTIQKGADDTYIKFNGTGKTLDTTGSKIAANQHATYELHVGTTDDAAGVKADTAYFSTDVSTRDGLVKDSGVGTFDLNPEKDPTASTDGKKYAAPYTGTVTITAYDKDPNAQLAPNETAAKALASKTVEVVTTYEADGDVTVSAKEPSTTDEYGYSRITDGNSVIWDVTNWDIVSSGAATVQGKATVNSVDATGAALVSDGTVYSNVDGASTRVEKGAYVGGNAIADTTTVAVSSSTVGGNLTSKTDTSVSASTVSGGITAANVMVSNASTVVTGDIKSTDGVVKVTGGTVGNISAGNHITGIGVSTTEVDVSAATTGHIYMNDVAGGAVNVGKSSKVGEIHTEGAVNIDSATVNGNITAEKAINITAKGALVSGPIDTVVAGDIYAKNNVTIGDATADRGNITVNGSVVDNTEVSNHNTTSLLFKLAQNGTKNAVKVNGLVAKQPNESGKVYTKLSLINVASTFDNLDNFTSITVDGDNANVAVKAPLTVANLTVTKGTITVPSASIDNVGGTGTVAVPAGKLVVNKAVTGKPVLSCADAKKDAILFTSPLSSLASSFNTPGLTLTKVDNGDKTYSYKVTDTKFAGIALSSTDVKVDKNFKATIKVLTVPADTKVPTGDTIKWTNSNNNNFTLTVAKDGLSAVVSTKSYSATNLNNINNDKVTVTVMKSTNVPDTQYKNVVATVTSVASVQNFKSDTAGNLNKKIGEAYTFKITSLDGKVPSFAVASNGAAVASTGKSGNDYFFKVTPAKVGSYGVYCNGTKVAILIITSDVKCDTAKVKVAAGKSYTFKVTSSAQPTFVVATVGTIKYASKSGNNYFYKVTATKTAGDHGVYINGVKMAVITFA